MSKYRDFDDEYIGDEDEEVIYDSSSKKQRQKEYDEEEYYMEENVRQKNTSKSKKKKKKKMKKGFKIAIIVAEVLVLVLLAGVYYVIDKMGLIQYTPLDRDAKVNSLSDETIETLKGYTNVLLLGTDSRDNSVEALSKIENNHSDSIIIASINNETGDVKLVSIYRDTILKMSNTENELNFRYNKATEAIFYYGLLSPIDMVNVNLDLDISDYILVNWNALIDIIDAVGGIDIEITETELYWTNAYLVDTSVNTGKTYTEVPNAGYVHLDGIQATAYCRVRYGGGDDYRRTERQRTVIQLVVDKAKNMSLTELNSAINAVAGNIATSLDLTEILSLASNITKYNIVDTSGFPFESQALSNWSATDLQGSKVGDPVVPADLTLNVAQLHEYLFGVTDYTPTSTVQEISAAISEWTGVTANK